MTEKKIAPVTAGWRKYLPPPVFCYWLSLAAWALVCFTMLRLLFLIRHLDQAKGIPASDILMSFAIGLRFDLIVIGCIVLPFIIVSVLPVVGFEHFRLTRKFTQPVIYFLFAVAFLLMLIDIEYFTEFNEHLGVWFYTYLDSPGLVWYMVSKSYPVFWYLAGWLVLSAVFIYVATRLNRLFKRKVRRNLLSRIGYTLLLSAIIAIRGSVTLAAVDWAAAYHSDYSFANALPLNGPYTLSRNLFEYYDDISRHNPANYRFYPFQEALETVQDLVTTRSDSLLEPGRSLKRYTKNPAVAGPPRNVVFIVMESWQAGYIGALGDTLGISPCFDSLAQKSLLFENLYAAGTRTNRGLLAVLCSFPSLPGRTVMKLYGSANPFMSIAEILRSRGYTSLFIYGGDAKFDNMGGFFRGKGFNRIISIKDFPRSDIAGKWGVPDHIMFAKANKLFAETYPQPFVAAIMTLSNHKPFISFGKQFEKYPPTVKYHDYYNAFYYSDWALGQFFKQAEKEEYFKHTIFVLVGDHSQPIGHPGNIVKNFRIASLIYCPGRSDIKPRRITEICGQTDLLPTVLWLLGYSGVQESWGRNILAPASNVPGFAFVDKGDTYGWFEDSLLLWDNIHAGRRLFKVNGDSILPLTVTDTLRDKVETMARQGRSFLQLEVQMVHDVTPDKATETKKAQGLSQ